MIVSGRADIEDIYAKMIEGLAILDIRMTVQ